MRTNHDTDALSGSAGASSRPPSSPPTAMTHREVLEALSGLLVGILVAILSSTVVVTSLPRIVNDLGGGQATFTWVITAALLATTVSTPVWGKLADLVNRKLLVQSSLIVFVVGSALAGMAQSPGQLITFRVVQGVGVGGLTAMVQIVMADIISPRDRGRYMGLLGAVMAVGTVGGPLVGGFITDALDWRWTFYAVIPLALIAVVVLQRTLHLPHVRRDHVRIDYVGALLVSSSTSLLLVWVTLAGDKYAWLSTTSGLMLGGAVLLAVAFVWVESRAAEPLIPLDLFRNRTFVLSVVASVALGVSMFASSLFLTQYLQLARGRTATESGLLTLPMVAGLLLSSIVIGQVISRTGVWKRYVVAGSVIMVAGNLLLTTTHTDTGWTQLSVSMFVLGAGIGMVMQNLVLVVQNSVSATQLGVGSSSVAFFRTLGGALGVSALGALLAARLDVLVADGTAGGGPVEGVIENAYGEAIGGLFLASVPLAIIVVIAVAFLPNARLGSRTGVEQLADELAASEAAAADAAVEGEAADGEAVDGERAGQVDDDRLVTASSRA
jgi:EmrB/QacA subfamily drug resistance transporter